jgi:anti-sigma regulatory factor (Ser/Thr protein kinase)
MEDLSLHILDVAENAVSAGATLIQVMLEVDSDKGVLKLRVSDDGRGMNEEVRKHVTSPFITTRMTRTVGLGLAMLAQAAESTGGSVQVRSSPGRGTEVTALFMIDHVDMVPPGDLVSSILTMMIGNPAITYRFYLRQDERDFEIDGSELRDQLGDVPLEHPEVTSALRKLIENGIKGVGVGESGFGEILHRENDGGFTGSNGAEQS